jgi:sugar lactone lactonase YvrE
MMNGAIETAPAAQNVPGTTWATPRIHLRLSRPPQTCACFSTRNPILFLGLVLAGCNAKEVATPDGGSGPAPSRDAAAMEASAPGPDAAPADTPGAPVCGNLPAPVPYKIRRGPKAAEDFVFDRDGMLISINRGNVWKTPFEGPPKLFAPAKLRGASGTRLLPNGDLVVAVSDLEFETGSIARVTPDGASSTLASGFSYPNGIEIGLDGFIYVADQAERQVVRVDGTTGKSQVLVKGMGLEGPNGVSFSPDYRTLYIGDFESGQIFALEVKPDGAAGPMRVFASNIGRRALDGLAVDECGNVYVDEFESRRIYRISPTGGTPVVVANLSRESMWIPNMQWGSGVGGWNPRILYVIDREEDRVYELDVGVGGKRVAHLP